MSEKKHALEDALKHINKHFGEGAIIKMWDNAGMTSVNTTHTGSYMLDAILWWWYPEGRVIEIYGPESSGKTTIALQAIAQVQSKWWVCAFIDAEHALDPRYAKTLWVDVDNLLLSQPDYGEQALQIAEELAKSGAIKLIVIDSVAALVPKAEVEWEMGDSHMWLQARMMSQWLRKLTSILAKSGTSVIFINQIRMKIGVMFGNPETTTGGNALKFFASQRLEVRKGEKIEENKEQIGYMAKIKVVKNKIFPPFKAIEIPIKFNMGIDVTQDIVDTAIMFGSIGKSGAFYSLWDKKFQGKEKLLSSLTEDKKLLKQLESDIISKIKDVRSGKKELPESVVSKVESNPA